MDRSDIILEQIVMELQAIRMRLDVFDEFKKKLTVNDVSEVTGVKPNTVRKHVLANYIKDIGYYKTSPSSKIYLTPDTYRKVVLHYQQKTAIRTKYN